MVVGTYISFIHILGQSNFYPKSAVSESHKLQIIYQMSNWSEANKNAAAARQAGKWWKKNRDIVLQTVCSLGLADVFQTTNFFRKM